ncbi:MAG: endonuclease [Betaproteobacteria bacterium]|nr:MAG: endonuclease [Betaproteobacteria bacterium]
MARRRRGRDKKPPIFQAALGATFLLGIALFGIPKKPGNLLLGVAAILIVATAVGVAVQLLIRKRNQAADSDELSADVPARTEPSLKEHEEADLYPLWKQGDSPAHAESVDTSRWSLDSLKQLEWRRFEEVCAGYFEALGFRAETTRFGADGGVDIKLYMGQSMKPAAIAQCKAWNAYTVGVKPVRELRGVMAAEQVSKGIFLTSGTFTKEAKQFVENKPIHLMDGEVLLRKIISLSPDKLASLLQQATTGDFKTPTCPSCGVKMVQRESRKDEKKFWGCVNFPKCRHKFFGLGAS